MSSGPLSSQERPSQAVPTPVPRELPTAAHSRRQRWLKLALPVAVLAVAFAVRWLLFATGPTAERAEPIVLPPAVRVAVATPETLRLSVIAHGTVTPRTESDLIAEVSGRVVEVSPALEAGSFFDAGQELLRLDGREHEIAVRRARATVKLRESEAALAAREAQRRLALAERDAASASDLQQFESRAAVAAASLEEARAQLAQAELDLERTVLTAPFDGRVRQRLVDVGQFVGPGTAVARLYAVDYAEVRLPIRVEELGALALPESPEQADGTVLLEADLAGRTQQWPARLVRSEGSVDPTTRMLYVVARVDDPQARKDADHAPIPAGLFVRAEIEGREIERAFRFPAVALREGGFVFVIDDADRLHRRPVRVAQRGRDEVVIDGGLEAGERVVVSPLRIWTEGMQVTPEPTEAPQS